MNTSSLDFNGRVAIVTGAGRGMGKAHALMLASRGCQVVVNDFGKDNPAAEVVDEINAAGGTAIVDTNSVTDSAGAIIEAALSQYGKIDILINNAGILEGSTLADTPKDIWWHVVDVHYRGTVDLCREAWPHLVKSGNGRILNTSSSGMLGNMGLTSYGSAKAAIFGFTRSLAIEGRPYRINVNCILPSAWTRMTGLIEDPSISSLLQKSFQPEHVSAFVTWLVHHKTNITNEAFRVSAGGAARVMLVTMPATRVSVSTPEAWAENSESLLASDGKMFPVLTTTDLFGRELEEVDPEAYSKNVIDEGGDLPLSTMRSSLNK